MTDAPAYDPLPDYVEAAHGNADACLRLSIFARQQVADGLDDPLTCSMEGATLARLAAIRGNIQAAILMGQHLLTVAELYEIAGDSSHAESTCAEALAILELTEGHTPPGWEPGAWSDHLLNLVSSTAAKTDADFMALTLHYRTIWARFLEQRPVQPVGDAQE